MFDAPRTRVHKLIAHTCIHTQACMHAPWAACWRQSAPSTARGTNTRQNASCRARVCVCVCVCVCAYAHMHVNVCACDYVYVYVLMVCVTIFKETLASEPKS